MNLAARLDSLGLTLPPRPEPLALYLPAVLSGSHVLVSGQLPMRDGQLTATGPVPTSVTVEAAAEAAGRCVLNALAALDGVLEGDWSRFVKVARLGVFVQSSDGFSEQHLVANGASQLLVDVFGDAGRHARAAVGVPGLPLDASVEVEAVFEVAPDR